MRTSLVINTCCMDPLAPKVRYGVRTYRERRELLHDVILAHATDSGWDEVIVVGTFEPGDDYRYVSMQPIRRDRRDALWQRELGARLALGDTLAFSHDDHMFGEHTPDKLRDYEGPPWDLLVPRRVDLAGNELNNGRAAGYMGGHSLIMKRDLWAYVPWTSCDTEWWDIPMTRLWSQYGKIVHTDALEHIDVDTDT